MSTDNNNHRSDLPELRWGSFKLTDADLDQFKELLKKYAAPGSYQDEEVEGMAYDLIWALAHLAVAKQQIQNQGSINSEEHKTDSN